MKILNISFILAGRFISLIIVTLLVFFNSNSRAQPLEKYWVYRERLKNFMVSTISDGGGIPAGSRALNTPGPPSLNWADAGWQIGYWIGTLAMEYKLLSDNGKDLSQTRSDLYHALYSIGRLDQNAEEVWECDPAIPPRNGFLLRDDVPSDFVNYADQLNECLVPPVNGFRAKCISSAFTDYVEGKCEASHDHWTGLFIGLTLVKRYIPEWENYLNLPFTDLETNFVDEVRKLSNRYISWLTLHNFLLFNPCEARLVKGIYNDVNTNLICSNSQNDLCFEEAEFRQNAANPLAPWFVFSLTDYIRKLFKEYKDETNTNLKFCIDNGGALAFPQALGLTKLNAFIQEGSNNEIPASGLYNNLLALNFPTPPGYGISFLNPLCPGFFSLDYLVDPLVFPFRDAWNIAFYFSISDKEPLFATLVALSNLTPINLGLPMSHEFLSNYLVQQGIEHKLEYLILLNNLLHGSSISNGLPVSLPDAFYECMLNSAPCRGFDGANHGTPSIEWGCGDDRLKGDINCPEGEGVLGWGNAAFPGLNYLFIHNLVTLSNPSLSGEFERIPIKQLSKDTILLQNYNEYDLKNFYANSLITVGNDQSNPDYVIGVDPESGEIGRVTFAVAPGGIIQFNDGFKIESGGYMQTIEDPEILAWNCNYTSTAICNPNSTNRIAENRDQLLKQLEPLHKKSSDNLFTQLQIIPNPGKEYSDFHYSGAENTILSFFITNSIGRSVFVQPSVSEFSGNRIFQIPLHEFSPGVYIVNFTIEFPNNEVKYLTKKFVVLK